MGLGVARLGIQPLILNQRWRMLFVGLAAASFDISATTRRLSGWGTRLLKSIPLCLAPRTSLNLSSWRLSAFSCASSKFQYALFVQGGVVKEPFQETPSVPDLGVQVEA